MTEQLKREQHNRRRRSGRDPLIGKYVDGRYLVLNWVGGGAYSNVYRAAETTAGDRLVALKIIRRAQSDYASAKSDNPGLNPFAHELEFSNLLTNESAVEVFQVGRTDNGVDYIAMEFIDGTNFGEFIRDEGPLELAEFVVLADQLLMYAAECHGRGFAHCDIKPDNLMLCEADHGVEFKVLDLGQARTFDNAQDSTLAAGTPAFIAPEIARGEPVIPASEIYACGAVLYEALTGDHAILLERPSPEAFQTYLSDPRMPIPTIPILELRQDCPESIAALIEWALERQPVERPRSAQELRAAILHAAYREGIDEPAAPNLWERVRSAFSRWTSK